jgi:hypothetical protein
MSFGRSISNMILRATFWMDARVVLLKDGCFFTNGNFHNVFIGSFPDGDSS